MQLADFFWIPANWLLANSVSILAAIAVLVVGDLLSKIAARSVRNLLPRANGVDKTFAPLLAQVARYGILVFAIVTALGFIGVPSTSVLAVLGAGGLAIVLALQGTLANIAAGIMLIWQRPIAIGEYITGDGVEGIVVEIGLFGTRLRSASGLYVFTPNQKLWSSAITNHSREPRRRIQVEVTVPDTINIARARKALLRVVTIDKRVLPDPPPTVHVASFTNDKVTMQLRAWVKTPDYLSELHHLTEEAKLTLNKELAAGEGGKAEIAVVNDPHAQDSGGAGEPGDER
jgi:small conductance mechanosensitive channel